ncbi:M23 family metallopeptidase [Actinacidiphila alni]|uniref:M23 family metallopeptidase n=1 Tax=Actinacidiphila alni TaxID=380248 RepID=UPI003451B6F1
MASNQPAYAPAPAAPAAEPPAGWDDWNSPDSVAGYGISAASGPAGPSGPDSGLASGENRHRLPRQRGMARGSAVLGVAAMAAVGAGGVAAAADAVPAPIAVPDLPEQPDLPDLPKVSALPSVPSAVPVIGDLFGSAAPSPRTDAGADSGTDTGAVPAADTAATVVEETAAAPAAADPGEALRARILDQATRQKDAAAKAEREAAEQAAAQQAARDAAAQKVREQAAAAKAAAEAKAKADVEAAAKAEAERLAKLAASYIKPVASYTLTDGFGEVSSLWANTHTGLDFAAPTGTPVHAVHSGTVTSAGWAGSYGYRVVLTLDDGTELWYCHLSTMVVTSGKVTTGDTIGRVGATGNVTGPHLHLEVRPGGGAPIDPAPWLRAHDIAL